MAGYPEGAKLALNLGGVMKKIEINLLIELLRRARISMARKHVGDWYSELELIDRIAAALDRRV